MADFVEICNVCARKAIIEAAKRIINSDKVCHSYSDLNFGVTFFGTQCISTGTPHKPAYTSNNELLHVLFRFVYRISALVCWKHFSSTPIPHVSASEPAEASNAIVDYDRDINGTFSLSSHAKTNMVEVL